MSYEITPFQIGPVRLSDFDAPEVIGNLGGKQQIAFHKFPGGYITAQLFGRVPEDITISQTLRGDTALSKVMELDALHGRPITLTWSGWSFYGVVEDVRIDAENIAEIKYTLIFKPVQANSSSSQPTPPSNQSLLDQAGQLASQQAAKQQFTANVPQSVNQINQQIAQTLNQNQNNLFNVPLGQIQGLKGAITALQSVLQPLILGTNYDSASAAADLNNTLQHMKNALSQGVPTLQSKVFQNPNLYVLAAHYYQDASKWTLIAKANGLLDPQPKGEFRLNIPTDPDLATSEQLTLL